MMMGDGPLGDSLILKSLSRLASYWRILSAGHGCGQRHSVFSRSSARLRRLLSDPERILGIDRLSRISGMVLVFILFARPVTDILWKYPMNYIIAFMAILFGLLHVMLDLDQVVKHRFVAYYILFLSFGILLSFSQVMISVHSVRQLGFFLVIPGMYLMARAYVRKKDDAVRLMNLIIASSFMPALYAPVQYMAQKGIMLYNLFMYRYSSTFAHPNTFAFYLHTIIMACLIMGFYTRKARYAIYASLMGSILIMTYSRAIIALASVSVIAFIFRDRTRSTKMLFSLAIVILILANPFLMRRLTQASLALDMSGRLVIWDFFLNQPSRTLLLGGGFGYSRILSRGLVHRIWGAPDTIHPHNDWILLLLETGLPGLILVMLCFMGVLASCIGASRSDDRLIRYFGAIMLIMTCSVALLMFVQEVSAKSSFIYLYPVLLGTLHKLTDFEDEHQA
ncbi:O-antigen ligase family protein [Candidatus Altiarchaeota archaeon]